MYEDNVENKSSVLGIDQQYQKVLRDEVNEDGNGHQRVKTKILCDNGKYYFI